MANNLGAAAIFVFTRRGNMAHFVSRCRPSCPIFAFTDTQEVRQRLNMRWGVNPFRVAFAANHEQNVQVRDDVGLMMMMIDNCVFCFGG